jgi:serine/threonine-protein kinase RsbW
VSTGPVTLTIPSEPSMVRVGRLTASSVASMADLTVDDIDDIKIAVSEVVTLLIEQGDGGPVTLEFDAEGTAFTIAGTAAASSKPISKEDAALTAAVLDAVCDSHELSSDNGTIRVRVAKTSAASEANG